MDLVAVCTANVARSPLLQVRLQWEADRRLGAGVVRVASAGTDAIFGVPAATGSTAVASRWELPLDTHHSQPLHYVDLSAAGLIVPMTRAHARAIARHAPDAAGHTIRLRELVRLIEQHGDEFADELPEQDPAAPRERIDAAIAAIGARRGGRLGRRQPGGRKLDLPDPIGADQVTFDALGEEIADSSATIAEVLFGPVR